jgi:hypothetical protein
VLALAGPVAHHAAIGTNFISQITTSSGVLRGNTKLLAQSVLVKCQSLFLLFYVLLVLVSLVIVNHRKKSASIMLIL